MNLFRFLLQLSAVIATCWTCGRLARLLRQPAVIGEIAGGLLLGPTVLGRWWPEAFARLFAAQHLAGLERLSSIGLILFLFLLGLEMDLPALAGRGRILLLTAIGSLGIPFITGAIVAVALAPRFLAPNKPFAAFALFIGTAYSITALPVLGRILRDRERSGRPVRSRVAELAFACATVNDGAAWLLLLLALTAARSDAGYAAVAGTLVSLALFLVAMVYAVRPLLREAMNRMSRPLQRWLLCVAVAFASAAATDAIGVHAFFGAVTAGAIVPRRHDHAAWTRSIEAGLHPVLLVALPTFFALTGLKTLLTLDSSTVWITVAIVTTAAVSKVLAGTAMARMGGMPLQMAAEVGVLLNTRGLVELIVLNVGLKAGVLTPTLFAALVVMAIATTAMTVPALDLLRSLEPEPALD